MKKEKKIEKTTPKMVLEVTKEELQTIWELVDLGLKTDGLKKLVSMHSLAVTLQKAVMKGVEEPKNLPKK